MTSLYITSQNNVISNTISKVCFFISRFFKASVSSLVVVSRLLMSRHPKPASQAHPGDVPTLHTLRSRVDEVSVWRLCSCLYSNIWSPASSHSLLVQVNGAGQ